MFGWCAGAFAEYARATEDHFVNKPANLTFEQAAAVGVSASTALQLLRDDASVRPGQRVLINGASGGVGTFAVQIAKAFGADVTGVQHQESRAGPVDRCRPRHRLQPGGLQSRCRALRRHPRQRRGPVDGGYQTRTHTNRAAAVQWRRTLGRQAGPRDPGLLVSWSSASRDDLGQNPEPTDLVALRELVEAGKVAPVIGGTYPLDQTADAIAHIAAGHARGRSSSLCDTRILR